MRKLSLSVVLCLLFMSFSTMIFAKGQEKGGPINLKIDGSVKRINMTVIENGELMLPVREVSETLGAKVGWDSKSKSVTINIDKTDIKVKVGSKAVMINGSSKTLKVPVKIIGSKTFVSLDLVTLCFNDMGIKWDKKTKTVIIEKKKDKHHTPTPTPTPTQTPTLTPEPTLTPTPTVDNTPFEVTGVNARSELTVEVSFSHQLKKISAEKIENYTIQAFGDSGTTLPVSKAELDNSGTKVLLTSSKSQEPFSIYKVIVNNVEDIYGNKIANFEQQFASLGNRVLTFNVDTSTKTSTSIELVCNMKLDKASAENIANYYLFKPIADQQCVNKIPIAKAELDSTGMRIKITFTSPLDTVVIYEITAENLVTSEGKSLDKEKCAFVVLPSQK